MYSERAQVLIPARSIRSSPRILYVSEAWTHGAQVRCLSIYRALREMGSVELMLLASSPEAGESISQANGEVQVAHKYAIERRPNSGPVAKLRFTLDPSSDYPYGSAVTEAEAQRIAGSKDFDVVWFFKQRSADMFPNMAWARSVLDIDDVQSKYEGSVLSYGSGLGRLKALRAVYIWKRRERLLSQRFSVLSVCSEEDRTYLRRMGIGGPIHVIPNGFEQPAAEPIPNPATPPRIGFIGGFDHLPNLDGMSWFLKECWPSIKREVPQARLRLIGRYSENFSELGGTDVDRLGWVPDPSDEIKTWSVMAVPIRLGAGTRIKIAQAFSQKCPIVSTSLGAFGYGAVNGREMYVADSSEAFSSACVKTICSPEDARLMAERAWSQFLEKWTWDAIRPRVWAAAEDCLRLNGRNKEPQ